MRVTPAPAALLILQAEHTARMAAGHRSSATDRPVAPPDTLAEGPVLRRTNRQTFDIRV